MLTDFRTVGPWSRKVEYVSPAQRPSFFVRIKNLEITIFWNVTPCSFEGGGGEKCSLYHHSTR
jgi:hypothetical protein